MVECNMYYMKIKSIKKIDGHWEIGSELDVVQNTKSFLSLCNCKNKVFVPMFEYTF